MAQRNDNEAWIRHLNQQPLDAKKREIRLLRFLLPEADGSPIAFELVRHELPVEPNKTDHARRYYALSYVWGSSEDTQSIMVDGMSVRVLVNLWHFLHGLRNKILSLKPTQQTPQTVAEMQPHSSRWWPFERKTQDGRESVEGRQDDVIELSHASEVLLWADFLCINQENPPERNSQVTMMASIFQQASAVIGWLGDPDSRQAAHQLKQGLHIPHYQNSVAPKRQKQDPPRPEKLQLRNLQRALALLATDLYWTRLWIVQEIVLAHRFWMLCQDNILEWDDYTGLIRYLHNMSTGEDVELPKEFVNPDAVFAIFRKQKPSPFVREEYLETLDYCWYKQDERRSEAVNRIRRSLKAHDYASYADSDASSIFQFLSCGEPRDRVYGMLGFIRPAQSKLIKVDYHKPLVQVYLEGCIALMKSTSTISHLFYLLQPLFDFRGPLTVSGELRRPISASSMTIFPSSLDLSSLQGTHDVKLASFDIPREVIRIEKLVVVLRRGDSFVTQLPQDCCSGSGDESLCFVYHLLTTRTQDHNDIRGDAKHNAAIVFATFEIKTGDLFHDVASSMTSSIVTRFRPNSPGFDVLGTAFTATHKGLNDITKHKDDWIYNEDIPNPIRWMRNRIPGTIQKIHIWRSFPRYWSINFVITLNGAAVMDHLENLMIDRRREHLPRVRVGREPLTSLVEAVDGAKSDEVGQRRGSLVSHLVSDNLSFRARHVESSE